MSPSKEKLFFVGSVFAQFAVLAGMIFFYQAIVIGGTEVVLKTVPIDPRDILRGQYVALRYDISTLKSNDCSASDCLGYKFPPTGDTLYVSLKNRGGIWEANGASGNKPFSGVFIKGTVVNIYGSQVNVKYGIESYFVSPDKATELEAAVRRGILLMKVVVDGEGNAVVRGVFDNGGAIPSVGNMPVRSRDARRLADISQLKIALELYFDSNGSSYPESLQDISPQFIPNLPRDPITGVIYYYQFCGPNSYHLGADLEDQTNGALLSADKDITMLCPGDKVHGADNLSCDGITQGKFCYDLAEGEPTNTPVAALPPKITVINPNTAQIFITNQGLSIRWSAQGVSAGGKFQVAILDEATKKIIKSFDLDGSQRNHDVVLMSAVFAPNKFYRVKISLMDSTGKIISSDESDKAFGISQ
jgi:uncharacterized membrane-anchored protein